MACPLFEKYLCRMIGKSTHKIRVVFDQKLNGAVYGGLYLKTPALGIHVDNKQRSGWRRVFVKEIYNDICLIGFVARGYETYAAVIAITHGKRCGAGGGHSRQFERRKTPEQPMKIGPKGAVLGQRARDFAIWIMAVGECAQTAEAYMLRLLAFDWADLHCGFVAKRLEPGFGAFKFLADRESPSECHVASP